MTVAVQDKVYLWEKADIMIAMVSAAGAATLEVSQDGQAFTPYAALPLSGGEFAMQVQLRNCKFKFTGITGTVTFKPEARAA